MTLWLTLAVMTAAAAFAVIWPLARHARSARAGGGDVGVSIESERAARRVDSWISRPIPEQTRGDIDRSRAC